MMPEEEAASSPWRPGGGTWGQVRSAASQGGRRGAQASGGPENRPPDGAGWSTVDRPGTLARRWVVNCWAQAWRLFQSSCLWVHRFPEGTLSCADAQS